MSEEACRRQQTTMTTKTKKVHTRVSNVQKPWALQSHQSDNFASYTLRKKEKSAKQSIRHKIQLFSQVLCMHWKQLSSDLCWNHKWACLPWIGSPGLDTGNITQWWISVVSGHSLLKHVATCCKQSWCGIVQNSNNYKTLNDHDNKVNNHWPIMQNIILL